MQGRFRRNPAVTLADYLEIIERKTASLFAAGARTAAHLAGRRRRRSSTRWRRAAATSAWPSRCSDDLLDVDGAAGGTGKPRGIDLRDGNPSLPIVLGAAGATPRLRAPVRRARAERRRRRGRRSPASRAAGVLADGRGAHVEHELDAALAALGAPAPPSDAARRPASSSRARSPTRAG